ncbi:MAG: endo-1,4-beta-xylanase, partial [Chloroflexota bacterium]|nr:endo-1,4-beta-xylanase [Chloroflexota bacterium]
VRTYKVARQLGRIPGQDLMLFYGDYNYEVPNRKADLVYQHLARLETVAADRLRKEGFDIANVPLVVDMQLHVDFNNPPKLGELFRGDVTEDKLLTNIKRFGNLGKVWIGEFSIRGGTREQRTDVVRLVVNGCLKSGGACESMVFWELMTRNGFYADGDLLFDHNFQPTETYNALVEILRHGVR